MRSSTTPARLEHSAPRHQTREPAVYEHAAQRDPQAHRLRLRQGDPVAGRHAADTLLHALLCCARGNKCCLMDSTDFASVRQ